MLPYVPPLKTLLIQKLNELWTDRGVVKFFKVKIKGTVWDEFGMVWVIIAKYYYPLRNCFCIAFHAENIGK